MSKSMLRQTYARDVSSTSLESLVAPPQVSPWQAQNLSIGKPSSKPVLNLMDCVATLTSVLCLCVAAIATTPRLRYAWQLGYTGQLIVIGAMLAVMNLCMHRVLPTLLVLIELTWGPSRLQNYDAILSNKMFASHVSAIWRITIILITALPIGLAVAYKRFLGGTASVPLEAVGGRYGIDFPQIGLYAPKHSPIYLQITSYAPLLAASEEGTAPFKSGDLPMAFGYNTLMLSSTSGAVLDVPTPSYVESIQAQLRANETWTISAEVEGYVASYNTSSEQLRTNDRFWNASIVSTAVGLNAFSLYTADLANIGTAPYAGKAGCWISVYLHGHDGWSTTSRNADNNDVIQFRKVAEYYNVDRRLLTLGGK